MDERQSFWLGKDVSLLFRKVGKEKADLIEVLQDSLNRGWMHRGIYQTPNDGANGHILLHTCIGELPEFMKEQLKARYGIPYLFGFIRSEDNSGVVSYALYEPDFQIVTTGLLSGRGN